jgi:ligand-binding SRPBCC domain-containing protein
MVDHVLESRLVIARPRVDVFAFFADPRHLTVTTPPWLRVALLTPLTTIVAGSVLDYRIRWLGIPLVWRAFVRECDPPFRFLDVQLWGPYSRWEHRHRFLETAEGTLMEDRIVYRLPAGVLGRLGHALLIRRQLAAIWAWRTRKIGELLGAVRSPDT